MSIKKIKETYTPCLGGYINEYICDTDDDFTNLPSRVCTGSTAVSVTTGTVKVVNTAGEWVTFGG